jgi:3D-(3,5/4)-trihydroxycyclohexane-1,2-dione acylhydrolase (decyclizing)
VTGRAAQRSRQTLDAAVPDRQRVRENVIMGHEEEVRQRARAIASSGGIVPALEAGTLPAEVSVSVSEGIVLGLLRQDVRKYFVILGHGNTSLGEILRIYAEEKVVRVYQCRNEVAMAHAATALRWIFGESSVVVASIGPGALQALAGSLACASNGIGVYHIYGDETTHGEGYNMQQVPKRQQNAFARMADILGEAYTLHTPESLRDMLRRGTLCVHRSFGAGPFYMLLPINVQPKIIARLNLAALPSRLQPTPAAPVSLTDYDCACGLIESHDKIVIKAGGGTRNFPLELRALAAATGGVVVLSPGSLGVIANDDPANMHVGGSKGTISGNYAMENASLAIIVGSRAVCQADCSGTGYLNAGAVLNINADTSDANHYNKTVALTGDIGAVLRQLLHRLDERGLVDLKASTNWRAQCALQKEHWSELLRERTATVPVRDPAFNTATLTQPAAIRIAAGFAKSVGAIKIFDAGDVQANGFQIVRDDEPSETITESGSSYMGFAVSSLLAGAVADRSRYMIAFTGDGSFLMNPQILVDGIVHGAHAMIVLFDNRRMAAISGLQVAQYGRDFATNDDVQIDFVRFATSFPGVHAVAAGASEQSLNSALASAYEHDGLSVVHVPVYWGEEEKNSLGAYGRWNVGPWVEDVEELYRAQVL